VTQDEVLATLHKVVAENMNYTTWTVSTPHLVALVNLAVEQEREACAKLCDDLDDDLPDGLAGWQYGEAIRARGQA
jgi:hypothetical protein